MYKYKYLIIILLTFVFSNIDAQEIINLEQGKIEHITSNNKKIKNHRYLYYGGGILNNVYQETKFSDIQYRGFGVSIVPFGWYKSSGKNSYHFESKIGFARLSAKTNDVTKLSNPEFKLRFSYLHDIVSWRDTDFKIGAAWDTDFTVNTDDIYYFFGNTLSINLGTETTLNNNNVLSARLGIGIVGLVKELRSFAFIAPQEYLKEGAFNYADKPKLINPFALNKLVYIGKYNHLHTEIAYHHDRYIFSYEWNLINYTTLKNYPSTNASHNIKISRKFSIK